MPSLALQRGARSPGCPCLLLLLRWPPLGALYSPLPPSKEQPQPCPPGFPRSFLEREGGSFAWEEEPEQPAPRPPAAPLAVETPSTPARGCDAVEASVTELQHEPRRRARLSKAQRSSAQLSSPLSAPGWLALAGSLRLLLPSLPASLPSEMPDRGMELSGDYKRP